jgi:hypothetical protein
MPAYGVRHITLFLFRLSRRGESAGHVKCRHFAPTWNAGRTKSSAFQTCFVRMDVWGGVPRFAISQRLTADRPKLPFQLAAYPSVVVSIAEVLIHSGAPEEIRTPAPLVRSSLLPQTIMGGLAICRIFFTAPLLLSAPTQLIAVFCKGANTGDERQTYVGSI